MAGKRDYVYPTLDPQTRTARVRLRFDNPQALLKPNMFAKVAIQTSADPNVWSFLRRRLFDWGITIVWFLRKVRAISPLPLSSEDSMRSSLKYAVA